MNNALSHRFSYQGWEVRISLHGLHTRGEISARAQLVDTTARLHSFELQGRHRQAATALGDLSSQARAFIDREARVE